MMDGWIDRFDRDYVLNQELLLHPFIFHLLWKLISQMNGNFS